MGVVPDSTGNACTTTVEFSCPRLRWMTWIFRVAEEEVVNTYAYYAYDRLDAILRVTDKDEALVVCLFRDMFHS